MGKSVYEKKKEKNQDDAPAPAAVHLFADIKLTVDLVVLYNRRLQRA